MKFYIARDQDGTLTLFGGLPVRSEAMEGCWVSFWDGILLPPDVFPELQYEHAPVEVQLTLKPKGSAY